MVCLRCGAPMLKNSPRSLDDHRAGVAVCSSAPSHTLDGQPDVGAACAVVRASDLAILKAARTFRAAIAGSSAFGIDAETSLATIVSAVDGADGVPVIVPRSDGAAAFAAAEVQRVEAWRFAGLVEGERWKARSVMNFQTTLPKQDGIDDLVKVRIDGRAFSVKRAEFLAEWSRCSPDEPAAPERFAPILDVDVDDVDTTEGAADE